MGLWKTPVDKRRSSSLPSTKALVTLSRAASILRQSIPGSPGSLTPVKRTGSLVKVGPQPQDDAPTAIAIAAGAGGVADVVSSQSFSRSSETPPLLSPFCGGRACWCAPRQT